MSVAPQPGRRSASFAETPSRASSPRARVALVVDHPLRDLPGMTLVAARLCEAGCECVLVPANLLQREIWQIAPDFVLLNYLRRPPYLIKLYRALARAGVAIGVLDTEGGVVESPDAFVRDLAVERDVRDSVACYCTWGPLLAEHLVADGVFSERQVFATGCPRTDFYAEPWRESISRRETHPLAESDSLILLNTNFSLVNPAMISREEQLRFMVDSLGHPTERIVQWQDSEEQGMRGLSELAGRLAERFPQATVVLRPHPFERLETYNDLLPDLSNLHCVRDGAIEPWLNRARAVIQRSCSTSIESAMIGAPAVSPNWLPTAFERPAANATSVPCQSPAELLEVVDDILCDRFTMPITVARESAQIVNDWYRGIDGDAHARVAQVVLDHLPQSPRGRRLKQCRSYAYTEGRRFPHKFWWRGITRAATGQPPLPLGEENGATPARITEWDQSLKRFDESDVSRLLDTLTPPGTEAASRAQPTQNYLGNLPHGRSVTLQLT